MVTRFRLRIFILGLVVIGGFSALLVRLWSVQMDPEKVQQFRAKVPGLKELVARIPGVRGEIRDRNGITLVTNKSSYEVILNLEDIVAYYRDASNGLRVKDEKGQLEPMPEIKTTFQDRDGIERSRDELDIVKIVRKAVIEPLESMGLAEDFNSKQLATHFRTFKGVVPWTYRTDLTFDEFAIFAEHNLNLPGVSVTARPIRHYPYDSLACHILGYTRQADPQKVPVEEQRMWDFFVADSFGVYGVERTMDEELRGIPGVRRLLKDEKGAIIGEVSYEPPKQGGAVYLTLDARVQMIAERALRDGKVGRGAAVVIDPSSGDVVAMASVPNFNPNKFIPSIAQKDFDIYNQNEANPLMNRAVRTYAPGSTYKIPIALAGCLGQVSGTRHHCAGGVQYGNKFMLCWIGANGGSHGTLGLSDAIMRSCNSFFYKFGNVAGIDNIVAMGKILGLGEKSGLEVDDEAPGVLPGPQWLRLARPGYVWTPSFTANTSIGQGDVLTTPLQMASVTATVANGGLVYRPRIIYKVERDGELYARPQILKHDLSAEGISRDEIEVVREGMRLAVGGPAGTARRAQIPGIEVAGKTGTAQFKRSGVPDNHAWFITFAPYDKPKYAICVLVQGGKSGGGVASPVARRIMEESLALEQGFEVPIKPLAEVEGSFDFIAMIDYASSNVALVTPAGTEDEDGDTGNVVAVRESSRTPASTRAIRPTIRSEADEGGRVSNEQPKKRFSFWKRKSATQDAPDSPPPNRGGLFRRRK